MAMRGNAYRPSVKEDSLRVIQGPICRGVGGFNPPNYFFDPPSLRRFELLGGVDSNPSVSVTGRLHGPTQATSDCLSDQSDRRSDRL